MVLVDIGIQSSVEATIPILAPLGGPPFVGQASPQVPEAQVIWVSLSKVRVETVIVDLVIKQQLAVTIVKGDQVVVEMMERLVLDEVGTHCMVTFNAVSEHTHDGDELPRVFIDGSEFELILASSRYR